MADKKKVVAAKKVVYANARDVARKQDQASGGYKAIKAPQGMEMFKWEKGQNVFDIIPYISSGGNPNCDKGLAAPERSFFQHTNVGPAKKQVICPAETFGKPCPICEHSAKMLRKGTLTDETKKALRAKHRQLMVVRVHNRKKALELLECGHFKTFGEMLKNKILGLREGHPCENYFSLDEGATLTVLGTEQKFDGGKFIGPASIELEPREKAIPESILDKVPDLDKLVRDATLKYEEIKALFEGGVGADGDEEDEEIDADEDEDTDTDGDDEEDEPAPPKKKGKKVVEEDEDDEIEEEETEIEDDDADEEIEEADEDEDTPAIEKGSEVSFMSKTKKKVMTGTVIRVKGDTAQVKALNGAWQEQVDLDDLTLVEDALDDEEPEDEEDEEEEEPAPKKKGKKAPVVEEDDEDEVEEDESDDDDEPFDGDDEDFDTNSDDEDLEDEEEEEPVKPVKKKRK